MARFVLFPCHLREAKFAPQKGAKEIELDWPALCEKLAPSGTTHAKMTLRRVEPGAYVGLAKRLQNPDEIGNFFFLNPDRSATLGWVLDKDPTFETRLVEVYRVDEVQWDEAEVHEFDTPGRPPWEVPRTQGGTKWNS